MRSDGGHENERNLRKKPQYLKHKHFLPLLGQVNTPASASKAYYCVATVLVAVLLLAKADIPQISVFGKSTDFFGCPECPCHAVYLVAIMPSVFSGTKKHHGERCAG